ncbi:MAG: hypothetical protein ACLKAK_12570 [Alkaliphilus sp.]
MEKILVIAKKFIIINKSIFLYYYAFILLLMGYLAYIAKIEYARYGAGMVGVSGIEVFTGLILLIVGLTSFKYNLELTQFLNISRKKLFQANIFTLAVVALFVTIIEKSIGAAIDKLTVMNYSSAMNIFYENHSFMSSFIWLFSYFMTVGVFGWFVGMLYYKSNSIVRVLIWLSPVIGMHIFSRCLLHYNIDILDLGEALFGFRVDGSGDPYVAVLTAVVLTAVCLTLNYLIIRRTIIKSGA